MAFSVALSICPCNEVSSLPSLKPSAQQGASFTDAETDCLHENQYLQQIKSFDLFEVISNYKHRLRPYYKKI